MSTYGLELEGASAERRLSRGAKIGLVTVGAVVGIRIVVGNLVINDWEGWGTFFVVATTLLVEGLVLGGLVFGLLVRLAARSRNPHPAVAALITGVLSVLSFAISYSAHQAILGAGAVALGLAAIDRAGVAGDLGGWRLRRSLSDCSRSQPGCRSSLSPSSPTTGRMSRSSGAREAVE